MRMREVPPNGEVLTTPHAKKKSVRTRINGKTYILLIADKFYYGERFETAD